MTGIEKVTDYSTNIPEDMSKCFVKAENLNPKVSVIIPCYNSEKYLRPCIHSLIKQTFKDFEVIFVNNGSADNTENIIQSYSALDSRIKLITQDKNDVSYARNCGITESKGEYITFVDSDDWINDTYIENLYNTAVKYDCDISTATVIRKREHFQKYRLHYTEEKVYTTLREKIDICRIPVCCYACGKLYKREAIENLKFKRGVYFEDVIWTPQAVAASNNLVTVPDAVYYYRVNNNSIVKKLPSKKKQIDSYRAKKFVIKFLADKGVDLDKKSKTITKEIKYLGKFPFLKIKDYNDTLTYFLFGILPFKRKHLTKELNYINRKKFFFLRKLDSHLYIELLKIIKIALNYKKSFKYEEVKEYGLEQNVRDVKLIISLTTFPERINTVDLTINTLLNQTVKPDRLILYLADEEFPNKEQDLPEKLLKLRDYGLEIHWCENIKSYKKLVPALKEFPEDIIVTADDDLYYQRDWLESLYNEYLKNPDFIYTRRACGEYLKDNTLYVTPHYVNRNYAPTYLNQLMGGSGTLYPPNSLYKDATNIEKIKNLIPTHDDIYFWIMAILNKTKICLIKNNDVNLYPVKGTQQNGLCKINKASQSGMCPKEAFQIIFKAYPDAYALIEEDSFNS